MTLQSTRAGLSSDIRGDQVSRRRIKPVFQRLFVQCPAAAFVISTNKSYPITTQRNPSRACLIVTPQALLKQKDHDSIYLHMLGLQQICIGCARILGSEN